MNINNYLQTKIIVFDNDNQIIDKIDAYISKEDIKAVCSYNGYARVSYSNFSLVLDYSYEDILIELFNQ